MLHILQITINGPFKNEDDRRNVADQLREECPGTKLAFHTMADGRLYLHLVKVHGIYSTRAEILAAIRELPNAATSAFFSVDSTDGTDTTTYPIYPEEYFQDLPFPEDDED
jgi:hypothetical protein